MVTTIRLSDATNEKLKRLVAETGRTKAYYLRELIEDNIEELMYCRIDAALRNNARCGRL